MAVYGELDRDTERFNGHDGDRANGGADRDEDERVLLAVPRSDAIDHDRGKDRDSQAVNEEAGAKGICQHLLDLFHRSVGRCVKDDNDGSEKAHGAAQFTQCP